MEAPFTCSMTSLQGALSVNALIGFLCVSAENFGLYCSTDDACTSKNSLMMVENDTTEVGESVHVICYESYRFEDGSSEKNRTCQLVVDPRGNVYPEWQGIGECELVKCPEPPRMPHAITMVDGLNIGSQTEYLCFTGYYIPVTEATSYTVECRLVFGDDNKAHAEWYPDYEDGCQPLTAF